MISTDKNKPQPAVSAPRYKSLRIPFIVLKDGTKIEPVNGLFIPSGVEELQQLVYLDLKNSGLVELCK